MTVAIDPIYLVCPCGAPKEAHRIYCEVCRAAALARSDRPAPKQLHAPPAVVKLSAAERQASARKMMSRRTWWTKQRVIEGLQRFHRDFGTTPLSTEDFHALVKGTGLGPRRRYPSFFAVLKFWPTFRQAWEAAGIQVNRAEEAYSPTENWYIREAMGILTRDEIAADLKRTPDAVHRHIYDMGWTTWDAHGWSINRLERVSGLSAHTFRRYAAWGDLPFFKGTKVVYVDPGDLTVVDELDFDHLPRELEEAMLVSLRARLVKVLAGLDWRRGRLHTSQPSVTGRYRRGSRHLFALKPAERPNDIQPGQWVEPVVDNPDRPGVLGRVGLVHLVYPANAKYSYVRSGGAAALWMARVEFKSLRGHHKGRQPRVTYSLPLETLRRVEPPEALPIEVVRGLEWCECGERKLPGRRMCWRCGEVASGKRRRDDHGRRVG